MRLARFCTECGAPARGKFCTVCGSRIMLVDDAAPKASEKPDAAIPGKPDTAVSGTGTFAGHKMTGFKYHRSGMSMGTYLMIVAREDGYDAVESRSEIPWPAMDGGVGFMMGGPASAMRLPLPMGMAARQEEKNTAEPPSGELIYKAGGMTSLVRVSREEGEAFFGKLTEAGILSWNGFSQSRSFGPGVLDGQDSFELRILFEDGQLLKACGSNAYPEGYADIMRIVNGFFGSHTDYSRYYPTEFPEETPRRLLIKIGEPMKDLHLEVDLEAERRRWSISVKDKMHEIVPEEVFIADRGEVAEDAFDRLQFSRFIALLRRYNMAGLNQRIDLQEGSTDRDRREMLILAVYSENRECRIWLHAGMSEYGDFFREIAREIVAFHEEIKDTSIL